MLKWRPHGLVPRVLCTALFAAEAEPNELYVGPSSRKSSGSMRSRSFTARHDPARAAIMHVRSRLRYCMHGASAKSDSIRFDHTRRSRGSYLFNRRARCHARRRSERAPGIDRRAEASPTSLTTAHRCSIAAASSKDGHALQQGVLLLVWQQGGPHPHPWSGQCGQDHHPM